WRATGTAPTTAAERAGPAGRARQRGSIRRRKPRTRRYSPSESRWSSQASQIFSRSGVCTRGLFQTRSQEAGARQPFAEHCGGSFGAGEVAATGRLSHREPDRERRRVATGEATRRSARRYTKILSECTPRVSLSAALLRAPAARHGPAG